MVRDETGRSLDYNTCRSAAEVLHKIPGEAVGEGPDFVSMVGNTHQSRVAFAVNAVEIVDGVFTLREHLVMENFGAVTGNTVKGILPVFPIVQRHLVGCAELIYLGDIGDAFNGAFMVAGQLNSK